MKKRADNLFEGILLLSDLDGTLLNSEKDIPQRNLDAIKYFTDKGGLFTVSTGRSPLSAREIAMKSGVNCPAVTLNGALIYDYKESRAVVGHTLPDNFKAFLHSVFSVFPQLGIQVYEESEVFVLNSNDVIDLFFIIEKLPRRDASFESLPDKANKILLGGNHELLSQVREFFEKQNPAGMYGMFTDPTYFEILPVGVNKGVSAQRIAKICNVKSGNVAAIGDYYNDIELLKSVDYPIVPDNAPDEIKKYAKVSVGHCDNGAVADAILHFEKILSRQNALAV